MLTRSGVFVLCCTNVKIHWAQASCMTPCEGLWQNMGALYTESACRARRCAQVGRAMSTVHRPGRLCIHQEVTHCGAFVCSG